MHILLFLQCECHNTGIFRIRNSHFFGSWALLLSAEPQMLDVLKRKEMLRQMILVRAFEEKLEELYQRKLIFRSTHSYRGKEAIAVGVCSALQRSDLIASYRRGTGHLIAKGVDLYPLLC